MAATSAPVAIQKSSAAVGDVLCPEPRSIETIAMSRGAPVLGTKI